MAEYRSLSARDLGEECHELIQGINRYNPGNLPQLEAYVRAQCRDGISDLDVNLAILKLYQLGPENIKPNIIALILIKALMNLPRNDFVVCKCLLSSEPKGKLVGTVLTLGRNLEACSFHTVWPAVREVQIMFPEVVGFEQAVREYCCSIINQAYRKISGKDLLNFLGNCEESVLFECAANFGWVVDADGNYLACPHGKLAKTRTLDESFSFETIAGVLAVCK